MPYRSWFTISALAAFSVACGGSSPTAPTSGADTLLRTTLSMGWAEVVDGYQVQASAYVAEGVYRDVTGFATWSTSDSSIATVNSVGFVTAHRAGTVAIRASYENASAFVTIDVVPGGLRRYYRALSGWVRDAADENKLAGVNVRIVAGANAGRNTVTGSDGAYQLYDLEPGTFRVQFSKPGYVTTERTFVLTGESFNGLDAFLNRSS
jgi:hypothetical protein